MKTRLISILSLLLLSSYTVFAQYTIVGGNGAPLKAKTDGALDVYLLNGLTNSGLSFTSENAGTHQWYKYQGSELSAIAIPSTQTGNTSTIKGLEDGWGYFVGFPEISQKYVWIIDYSLYKPEMFSIKAVENDYQCEYLNLEADLEAEPLMYDTPGGQRLLLQRTFTLTYDNLQWDNEAKTFIDHTEILELQGNIATIPLNNIPLKNTVFTLSGDYFAAHFGESVSMSVEYQAVALEVHSTAETDRVFGENEHKNTGTTLGGSAPVEYTFTGYANEPVAAFYNWTINKIEDNGTKKSVARMPESTMRFNFETEGRYQAQLEVRNFQSSCIDTSQIHTIVIGETYVKIPNAFSPGSSIGTNDEFRIAYRSIIDFRASIFNRWGNLLYRWTDPQRGWDGRVNGKFVPTGVYYVIVEYTDSKGKKHSESKDVNILRESTNRTDY